MRSSVVARTKNHYIVKAIIIRILGILNVVHLETALGSALPIRMVSMRQSNLLKATPRG